MKKMKFILCLAMSVSFLAGCGESVPSDWQYTYEDAANFNVVDSEILKTDDNNVKILRIMHSEILADEIKDDDFLIFDYGSLIKTDPSEGYFSYQDIKGCSVKSIKHEVNENDYTIDVYFEGNDENIYGAIFNKDATYNNDFLFTVPELNALDNGDERDQDRFERELLESPNPEKKDGYIDLISHFDQLCKKIPNEQENATFFNPSVVSLILSAINFVKSGIRDDSLPENYFKFNEILDRLNEIDAKLNGITNLLLDLLFNLQFLADRTEVDNCTRDIATFKSSYVEPIYDFYRNFSDGLALTLKEMAMNGANIEVPYVKRDDGKYYRVGLFSNETPTDKSHGNIKFDNAKKYLDEHQGRVDENFVKNLSDDILAAIKDTDDAFVYTKLGLTKENVATHVFEHITENYFKDLFTNPSMFGDAAAFRNKVINFINQYYAKDKSIVAKYVTRCQLFYNFGAEAERSVRNNLAALMFELEKHAAFAQMVCRLSGVLEDDLTDFYINARSLVKEAYQNVKNIPSNFCFRDGMKWDIKLFAFTDDVPGDPYTYRTKFEHQLKTYEIQAAKDYYRFGNSQPYNLSDHTLADTVTIKSAVARYFALKETLKNISLFNYFLKTPGVVNPGASRHLNAYITEYGNGDKSIVNRIFSKFGNRPATVNDRGTPIKVVAKGDTPPRAYFNLGDELGYMQHEKTKGKDDYWNNAKFYTADVFDADTGTFTSQKDINMYCDYYESHWNWSHPQVWAFSGIHRYKSGYTGKEGVTTSNYGLIIETTK